VSEQRAYNLPLEALQTYIDKPKVVYEGIDFNRYEKNGAYKVVLRWQNAHTYMEKKLESELFIEIECRQYPDFTYHSFMLQLTYKKHVNVLYQIEVYPDFKLSHREKKNVEIYGSHIHNLYETNKVQDLDYDSSWYGWLKYFCTKANIEIDGKHQEPMVNNGLLF